MNTFTFNLNGREFSIEKSISGDYCSLFCDGFLVIDDSACEDFYGEPEELVDTFKYYIEEEASKRFPWWVLMGAVIEQGCDQTLIECKEDAKSWSDTLQGARIWEIEDEQEKEIAERQLDIDDATKVYAFVNQNRGNFCLAGDY